MKAARISKVLLLIVDIFFVPFKSSLFIQIRNFVFICYPHGRFLSPFEMTGQHKIREFVATQYTQIRKFVPVRYPYYLMPYSLIFLYSVRSEMPSSFAAFLRFPLCLINAFLIISSSISCKDNVSSTSITCPGNSCCCLMIVGGSVSL